MIHKAHEFPVPDSWEELLAPNGFIVLLLRAGQSLEVFLIGGRTLRNRVLFGGLSQLAAV